MVMCNVGHTMNVNGMESAAAYVIPDGKPDNEYAIPNPFDSRGADSVSAIVNEYAAGSGMARK